MTPVISVEHAIATGVTPAELRNIAEWHEREAVIDRKHGDPDTQRHLVVADDLRVHATALELALRNAK